MPIPAPVQQLADAWSSIYGNSNLLSGGILFLHLAGLLVGGGAALAADRRLLRARTPGARESCLAELPQVHRIVVPALIVMVLSGILMALADLEVFLESKVFYLKLSVVVLLAANGLVLRRLEGRAITSGGRQGWGSLRLTATLSGILWLAIVALGVWLTKSA
jgi:hypothetical protein